MNADAPAQGKALRCCKAALFTLLVLGGCAQPAPSGAGARTSEGLYEAALRSIDELYIANPNFPEIAVAGIHKLSDLDSSLDARFVSGRLELLQNGGVIEHVPIDESAPPATWGAAMERLLESVTAHSPKLQKMPADQLQEQVFAGILSRLDRDSGYASADDAKFLREQQTGGRARASIGLGQIDGNLAIMSNTDCISPLLRSPRYGDVVLTIDGQDVSAMTPLQANRLLYGPPDSKVDIEVSRPGVAQPLHQSLVRRRGSDRAQVHSDQIGSVGFVQICTFASETTTVLRKTFRDFESSGNAPKAYLVDLRGNPGGLLSQAISTSNLFLEHGKIVSTTGRNPDSHQFFEATEGDITQGKPIAVLIDGSAAAGAEIVAMALQAEGRAVIIGGASLGRGSIQNVVALPDGSELALTWAQTLTPDGAQLTDTAVIPSLCTARIGDAWSKDLQRADLSEQEFPIIAKRHIVKTDASALRALRTACGQPTATAGDDRDIGIATALLADRQLYDRARQLVGP
ncbi:S41 family peptidase [Dongia sedimenti]|uniref:S41 family peptidase n=1 Tax=Dongia sedimenti TaxID=3064282 RepID=A0ABU0YGC8_9PROT|nr:S41 family peptidase [Rhodospirillaceae bacterium R-7]